MMHDVLNRLESYSTETRRNRPKNRCSPCLEPRREGFTHISRGVETLRRINDKRTENDACLDYVARLGARGTALHDITRTW